jgi:orotate phosphoribosyltransferase
MVNNEFSGKIVLVVEDNELNCLLCKKIFQKLKITVIWAENGIIAVEKVKKNQSIDIVFMDVMMPQMNGNEAARLIREFKKDIYIIAQTALETNEEIDILLFDAIIQKPLYFQKVKNILNYLIKMNTEINIAKSLLQINAVELNPNQPFTWASGLKSPIYCDNRKTLSYPNIRDIIRKAFCDEIKTKYPDVELIAGVATGGIALGVLVAQELNLPFAYVRSSSKNHGMENLIEGVIIENQKIVVIEDLISTGGSSLLAVEALRNKKCNVLGLLAIFTYGFEIAIKNFQDKNCEFHTLTNFSTLVKVAFETNYISTNDLKLLLAWKEQPENWIIS